MAEGLGGGDPLSLYATYISILLILVQTVADTGKWRKLTPQNTIMKKVFQMKKIKLLLSLKLFYLSGGLYFLGFFCGAISSAY